MSKFYVIFAQKIIEMPEFFIDKLTILEFYMTFSEKCPNFTL